MPLSVHSRYSGLNQKPVGPTRNSGWCGAQAGTSISLLRVAAGEQVAQEPSHEASESSRSRRLAGLAPSGLPSCRRPFPSNFVEPARRAPSRDPDRRPDRARREHSEPRDRAGRGNRFLISDHSLARIARPPWVGSTRRSRSRRIAIVVGAENQSVAQAPLLAKARPVHVPWPAPATRLPDPNRPWGTVPIFVSAKMGLSPLSLHLPGLPWPYRGCRRRFWRPSCRACPHPAGCGSRPGASPDGPRSILGRHLPRQTRNRASRPTCPKA